MIDKRCFIGLLVCFSMSNANADVDVRIEHSLPIEKLQFIPHALALAANREESNSVVHFGVSDSITLGCPPLKPDNQGNGCYLLVNPTTSPVRGQLSFSLKKPIERNLLTRKITEIAEKISTNNANTSAGDLHIGNPLYSPSTGMNHGADYYCAPEGEAGKKIWQCYLGVAETLKQVP